MPEKQNNLLRAAKNYIRANELYWSWVCKYGLKSSAVVEAAKAVTNNMDALREAIAECEKEEKQCI